MYLDAAASTPLSPAVLKAMRPYFRRNFGNPGSVHKEGVEARRALGEARVSVARTLLVRTEEITFTSGGTEANNLALFGVIDTYLKQGRKPESLHVLSTTLEHSSVLTCLKKLQERGVVVEYIPLKEDGLVDVDTFAKLLRKETVLVSVHYVNGEIGVIQPLRDISRAIGAYRARYSVDTPHFHTDASQAPLYLDCALEHVGVDMMTLDGQKIYGPKGIGVLIHRRSVLLAPQIVGGGQEAGLRSGTEPVPLVVGFASALREASNGRSRNVSRITKLRDVLLQSLTLKLPPFLVNGSMTSRVPNNVNISFPGIDTEYLVIRLDRRGVAASTRSACEGKETYSHVVYALSQDQARARSTLRLTLPLEISARKVRRAAKIIAQEIKILTKYS